MHPLRLSLSCVFSRTGPTLFFQAGSNIPEPGTRTLSRQKTVSAKTQAPCANFSAQGACIIFELEASPGSGSRKLPKSPLQEALVNRMVLRRHNLWCIMRAARQSPSHTSVGKLSVSGQRCQHRGQLISTPGGKKHPIVAISHQFTRARQI